jgi:hypothetical protein
VTRQRVRPHHRPIDVVGDVGEKGGAIAGLESLKIWRMRSGVIVLLLSLK